MLSKVLAAVFVGVVAATEYQDVPQPNQTKQCKEDPKIALQVLQDASQSSAAGKKWMKGVKSFVGDLGELHPGSKFMLSSYSDVPLPPFGCKAFNDHCFGVRQDWSTSTGDFSTTLDKIAAMNNWGADRLEGTLMALSRALHNGKFATTGDSGLRKVALIGTDSKYHEAGDMADYTKEKFETECKAADDYANMKRASKIECCKDLYFAEMKFVKHQYGKDGEFHCGSKHTDGNVVFEDYPEQTELFSHYIEQKVHLVVILPVYSAGFDYWVSKKADWNKIRKDKNLTFTEGGHMIVDIVRDDEDAQKTIKDAFVTLSKVICGKLPSEIVPPTAKPPPPAPGPTIAPTASPTGPTIEFEGHDPATTETMMLHFTEDPFNHTPVLLEF